MKCFFSYRIHLHTGVVIVVRAKIDDNSGYLARARDTIIVFFFFRQRPHSAASPLHSLTRCEREAKRPLGLGLSHRIEGFETLCYMFQKGSGGGEEEGLDWVNLIKVFPAARHWLIDHIDIVGFAWLIQLNVDCFIERLWKSKPPIDIDFGAWRSPLKHEAGTGSGSGSGTGTGIGIGNQAEAEAVAGLQFRA